MQRYKIPILFNLVVLCIIIAGVWRIVGFFKPRHDFRRLLDGDQQVHVSALVLLGSDGDRITVDDPDTVEYLNQAFRSARRGAFGGGSHRGAEVLISGGYTHCAIFGPDDEEAITVAFEDTLMPDDPENCYLVQLPRLMPPELSIDSCITNAPTA
jgi:hypothetical protein